MDGPLERSGSGSPGGDSPGADDRPAAESPGNGNRPAAETFGVVDGPSANPTPAEIRRFRTLIYDYYRAYGRDFPWRQGVTPYKVFLSEFMLQQTQVSRVEGYFRRFLESFPEVGTLASASLAEVLTLWQGLGYNRRAKHLWLAAREVADRYGGKLPEHEEELRSLPGIGPYTAAAIRAFAFNIPAVVIDTNIRRIFIHFFFPGAESVHDREIVPIVEATMDRQAPREWYYALMDYGAILSKWFPNPNRRSAHYAKQSPFENSNRQIRGKILRWLTGNGELQVAEAPRRLDVEAERLEEVLDALEKEAFIRRTGDRVTLA